MKVTAADWKLFLKNVAKRIEEEKEYLCELDRKLGDGDHGITMSIGWQAINQKLDSELMEEQDVGKIMMVIARTFLSATGSSVGPLYATGFIKGAKSLQNKTETRDEDLTNFWISFIEGIKERGKAEVGEKTMIDALEPAMNVLKLKYEETGNFLVSFTEAVKAAEKGMEETKDLISKRGRSSRLGERSIGTQDPGATSAYLILETFLQNVKTKQNVSG